MSSIPKLGVWAWSFVGFVVATVIVVTALAAVNEIVLPLVFAAVLAMVFKPLVGKLERRGLKPTLARRHDRARPPRPDDRVIVATARAWSSRRMRSAPRSTPRSTRRSTSSPSTKLRWKTPRRRPRRRSPAVAEGFITKIVSGVEALVGLASGLILGALIMYYLLKDGTSLRRVRRRAGRPFDPRRGRQLRQPTPARSSATTGGAAPRCPRSSRWSSASPASCSVCRSCSRSWSRTSSAATSRTSAPSSVAGWP